MAHFAPESVAHFAPENSRKALAQKLNPFIQRLIDYYHKFWQAGMRDVWNGLNHRLLKWVKWEKGLYKYASLRWLKQQYKEDPGRFSHWKLVHPSLYLCEHAQQGSRDKEHEALCEGRLSRTVLWEGRGEIALPGSISGYFRTALRKSKTTSKE